jgi:3-oxoadipate enol-lactonase
LAHEFIARDGARLHVRTDGPPDGPPVLFLHALGADHRLWDRVIPLLDPGLYCVRPDLRGHGGSDVTAPPYGMGMLVSDAEAVADALGLREAVVVGLSLGGLVAQGLAVKRLDVVRALVLSGSAARIGTPAQWADRIAAVEAGGMAAVTEAAIPRWFARDHRAGPLAALWRERMLACDPAGWRGCAAAVAGADFWTTTAGLRLPLLAIAGTEDGSTPADLVRETAELVPGAEVRLIRRTGHVPCVEDPVAWAETVQGFLDRIGHRPGL